MQEIYEQLIEIDMQLNLNKKKKKERSELKGATECMHSEIEIEVSGYTVNRCVRVQTKYKQLVDFDVVQLALSEINIQFCAHLRFKNVTKPKLIALAFNNKLTCSKNQLYSKDYITKQHNFSLQNCISCSQLAILILNSCFYLIQQISRFHPFSAGKNLDNFLFHFTTSFPLERTD
ncbi:hypothetical protein T01_282 [Trichinella spiralis]|uniref:Uncharacterized protein n=1 Tax=Trichinella spiralis TaxID=6334 RepID=A0A0V1C0Z4_TRISP|nr:hypothetical protein T01_282 [Trichinella spiralis]